MQYSINWFKYTIILIIYVYIIYYIIQYTAPKYTTVDLRHSICPTCDEITPPTVKEVLHDIVGFLHRTPHILYEALSNTTNFIETGSIYYRKLKKHAIVKKIAMLSMQWKKFASRTGTILSQQSKNVFHWLQRKKVLATQWIRTRVRRNTINVNQLSNPNSENNVQYQY